MGAVCLRMRAELRARWRSVLAVTILVAVAAATVLTAAAGARRAASTVDRYIADSRTSDVFVQVGTPENPADPAVFDAMEDLPEVETLGRVVFYGLFVAGDFFPTVASVDGLEGNTINRHPIVDGRRANPEAADEIVLSETTADQLDVKAGSRLQAQSFAPEQLNELEQIEGGDIEFTGPELTLTVAGIARTGQDLVSRPGDFVPSLLTPAFDERYRGEILELGAAAEVRLHGDEAALTAFRERVDDLVGSDSDTRIESIAALSEPLDDAVKVVATGLWIFAATTALASLVALGVVLGRQAFFGARDDATLAAMGMGPGHRFAANLLPLTAAATVGSALGVVGAVLASSIMPVGDLAHRIEPNPGLDVDAFVLALGFVAMVAVVVGLGAVAVWRESSRATAPAPAPLRPGTSWQLAKRLAGAGAGPVAVTGVRMAFEPGRGRTAVPVRPALVGAVAGITGLVAALTFGAGLGRLTSSPARYGFGWDVSVAEAEPDDLRDDPDVEGIAEGLFQLPLTVGGRPLIATGIRPIEGEVFTTIIEGQPARASDEIVLGGDTLDKIGRSIGDAVEVAGPAGASDFRIVGRGVFPSPGDPYPLADGAVVTWDGLTVLGLTEFPDAFSRHLVVWRDGVDEGAATSRLAQRYEVSEPSSPPEVARLDQITALPPLLAGFLGLLAVLAVGYALVTAVQRRRRDFAVLGTLGFVGRQVSATVAWQASTLVLIGLVFGIPLGLIAGRWAWILVAEGLGIATDTAVPIGALVIAVPAALLVANAIAFVPGRIAARTRPAVVLRTE